MTVTMPATPTATRLPPCCLPLWRPPVRLFPLARPAPRASWLPLTLLPAPRLHGTTAAGVTIQSAASAAARRAAPARPLVASTVCSRRGLRACPAAARLLAPCFLACAVPACPPDSKVRCPAAAGMTAPARPRLPQLPARLPTLARCPFPRSLLPPGTRLSPCHLTLPRGF